MRFTKIFLLIFFMFCAVLLELPNTCEEAMKLAGSDILSNYKCEIKKLGEGNFGRVFLISEKGIEAKKRALKIQKIPESENLREIIKMMRQKKNKSVKMKTFIQFMENETPLSLTLSEIIDKIIEDGQSQSWADIIGVIQKESMSQMHGLNDLRQNMLKLDHPNLIKLISYKITNHHIIEIQEYAEKGELYNLVLEETTKPIKIYDKNTILKIFQQLLEGVKYLHSKGFVHGDLKPENILFDKYGVVKITDFDFMTQIDTISLIKGTIYYMDPIFFRSDKVNYDKFVDVYALGTTLGFISQGGKDLFSSSSDQIIKSLVLTVHKYKLHKNTDIEIAFLINRCVQLEKKDRLSVDQLLQHVNNFLKDFKEEQFIQKIEFSNIVKMDFPSNDFYFHGPIGKESVANKIYISKKTHSSNMAGKKKRMFDKMDYSKQEIGNRKEFEVSVKHYPKKWCPNKTEAKLVI